MCPLVSPVFVSVRNNRKSDRQVCGGCKVSGVGAGSATRHCSINCIMDLSKCKFFIPA